MADPLALHLLLVHLRPGLSPVEKGRISQEMAALGSLAGVLHAGRVEAAGAGSTHDLALFVYLRDAAALERFGTDERYMDYLRRSFLPAVDDFVSMDVAVAEAPPAEYGAAACFCVDFPARTYEWQVSAALSEIAQAESAGARGASLGRALNKRQPYRAGGIVFSATLAARAAVPLIGADGPAVTSKITVVGTASRLV